MQTLRRSIFGLILFAAAASVGAAQSDVTSRAPADTPNDSRNYSKGLRETLAKQRAERNKKEFQELLERGDQAVKISEDLERSFESNNQLTDLDRSRLQTLEKLVTKIRSELGADDDNVIEQDDKPLTDLQSAFAYLKDSADKLAEQLKKSTRFTVSAAAIQTSNNFLRVIKFLRLRR